MCEYADVPIEIKIFAVMQITQLKNKKRSYAKNENQFQCKKAL